MLLISAQNQARARIFIAANRNSIFPQVIPKDVQVSRENKTYILDLFKLINNDSDQRSVSMDVHRLLYQYDKEYFMNPSKHIPSVRCSYSFRDFYEILLKNCSDIERLRNKFYIQDFIPSHFWMNCQFAIISTCCCNYSQLVK